MKKLFKIKIDKDTVKDAFAEFNKHKTGGPDGIKPWALQELGDKTRERIAELYTASLRLGWIPSRWKESKIIFIPKDGKMDYSDPRAYRPITLTSFLLKGLERIILWHVEKTVLRKRPLHKL